MKHIFSIFVLFIVFVLQGCGVLNKEAQNIENTNWKLVGIADFDSEKLDQPATIKFANQSISGFTGCNSYSGQLKQKGESLIFSEILGTFKSCQPGSKTESMFLDALKNADSYKIKKGKLFLMTNSKVIAIFDKISE